MLHFPKSNQYRAWRPPYNLQLDTTTYCNAKCPQCSRTDPSKGAKLGFRGKNKEHDGDLPLIHVSFEKFKKAFNEDTLKNFKTIQFCPTWGDHMMHPYAKEMFEHILSNSTNTYIQVDTNGSMRDEQWWWEVASLGLKYKGPFRSKIKKRLQIKFDIDGINQEMHSIYRRNTNLKKILSHMKVCSEFSDYIDLHSQTILFRHNENYLEDIKKLCYEHGSQLHTSVTSDRWHGKFTNIHHDEYYFYDENDNKQVLKKVSPEFYKKFNDKGGHIARSGAKNLTNDVVCGWSLSNTLVVCFDGNVWPCCFYSNAHHNMGSVFLQHPFIKKYFSYNNNIYETPIEEILSNDWWKELPYTFVNNPNKLCLSSCSNFTKDGQLRTYERL